MLHYIIVDDEVLIRRGLISKINEITSLSIACAGEAADGIEGLALIEEKNPDIIITDMKMRNMDGMEFLEKIYETYPDKAIIVISGYKAFDYVNKAIEKKAVGYVLKPFSTEEIEKQLQKAAEQINRQKNIIKLEEKVALFEQKKEWDYLLRAILEPYEEGGEQEENNWYLLLSIYARNPDNRNLAQALCDKHIKHIPYYMLENPSNQYHYFILLEIKREELVDKAKIKANHIAGHLACGDGRMRIFIGTPIRGLERLNRSYLQCEKLIHQVCVKDKTSVLPVKELAENGKEIYTEEEMKELFRHLKYKKGNEKELLNAFFNRMDASVFTLGQIGNSCEILINKVNAYARQNGTDTDDIMSVFYKRYMLHENLEKMKMEISGYVILIFSSVDIAAGANDRLFEQMQEYILNNWNKRLTLQMLANEFYISAQSISSLLKEKLHMSFNEYLVDIRIEQAKNLLRETELSVEQISNEIGYSNPKYFFKIFKKTTKKTPIAYRNGCLGNEKGR